MSAEGRRGDVVYNVSKGPLCANCRLSHFRHKPVISLKAEDAEIVTVGYLCWGMRCASGGGRAKAGRFLHRAA
jgi:hypothetical protein